MTSVSSDVSRTPPWLSVWLRPRATVDGILTGDPARHVLLLAALYGIAQLVFQMIGAGWEWLLIDWRVATCVVICGALWGMLGLYISALFLRWTGWLLGGDASQVELRAVQAWGFVPAIAGLVVALGILLIQWTARVWQQNPSAILTTGAPIVAAILGLWSVTVTMLMLARVQQFGFWRTIVSYAIGAILLMLLIALVIRTFLFQPFNMPSGSMEPTLIIGDYFFVSKYPYGYSRYSLPFSPPLFSGRIFGAQPRNGDVVVFRLPRDPSVDYVKRVVGLPGDRIQMIQGQLYLNGMPVKRERLADIIEDGRPAKHWRETLPNGASYETLDLIDNGPLDNTPIYVVPPDQYFMLGDNRDNSQDSRITTAHGYVPFENLVGRADVIFFSIDRSAPGGNPSLRSERIGMPVR
jgi:signal peptidase I